jgi:Rieske Fe-S protein
MTTDLTPFSRAAQVALDRRTVLGAACVGCASLLAACGSSDDSGSAEPAASSVSGGGGAALATLADIKVGESASAKAGGKNLLVTRTSDATAVAFSAVCTHQGCTVEPDGTSFSCPCHGSKYKASDGSVVNGPATRALAAVQVTVTNGQVFLA